MWTTTPWTLPSNVGVAVNPGATYVKVHHRERVLLVPKDRKPPTFIRGRLSNVIPRSFSVKDMEYLEV